MLMVRVATAGVLLASCISALFVLPNTVWALLLLPMLFAAAWEWAALAGLRPADGATYAGLLLISALLIGWAVMDAASASGGLSWLEAAIFGSSCVFWLFIAVPWLVLQWTARGPLVLGIAGWIVLVPTWLALVRLQPKPGQMLALLGIIWLADTAAYCTGRAWGRHPLAPRISPGKTWEGVAGAGVAVAVYYVALSSFLPEWIEWQGARGAALFAGVAVMSVVGDLFESSIKRRAGVKDSGSLLPGHGGILDRIDSMTSTLPLGALVLLGRG